MKMNENVIVIDKCRLCLADYDNNDLMPIFPDNDDSELSLAARIMVCLSIPVRPRDSLPCGVCKICENHLSQFYAFREICYDSYYSLLGRRLSSEPNDYFEGSLNREEIVGIKLNGDVNRSESEPIERTEIPSESNISPAAEGDAGREFYEETLVPSYESTAPENSQPAEEGYRTTDRPELSNEKYRLSYRIDETRTNEDVRDDEDAHSDEEVEDIRYKCLCCDVIFSDLESASVHCADCSPSRKKESPNSDEISEQRLENDVGEEIVQETPLKLRQRRDPANASNQRRKSTSLPEETNETSKINSSSPHCKRKTTETISTHSCPNCEGIFSTAALLRRHSYVHTGSKPFECPVCQKRFSQLGQLNFHKKFHYNPRYRCEICEKPFLRPSDISKHMRTHTGEKPFVCTVCGKSFAQLVALQQHERIHTGVKPYVCEICGKKFSQKANKTKHVKIHKEGSKPHVCDLCGRSFADLNEMKLHRDGHGGGKPRKCDRCDLCFRKTSELSQHVRRYHTFEKPHECAFCQKAFYSLYNLKQHVMVHTGQKPYGCKMCDLKFTQKGNLTKHVERKHGDDCAVVGAIGDDRQENGVLTMGDDIADDTTDFDDSERSRRKFDDEPKSPKRLDGNERRAYDENDYAVVETANDCDETNDREDVVVAEISDDRNDL